MLPPDHGEKVYDYRDSFGRVDDALTPERLRYQFEIPMFVWFSLLYKQHYPQWLKMHQGLLIASLHQIIFAIYHFVWPE